MKCENNNLLITWTSTTDRTVVVFSSRRGRRASKKQEERKKATSKQRTRNERKNVNEHSHEKCMSLDWRVMGAKRERYCRFGSRHSYRSESSKWFLICSRFSLALLIPGSIVCVCVDTEEWRYHALPKWPECESPIEYGLVHKQWFPTNRRARKEWEKIRGFFPILLYEFFFPTTQNKHQASQIEVKRILNWQNALDIVLTPFVITSSCMHTPPTATAAIAAGQHRETIHTQPQSHTVQFSWLPRASTLFARLLAHNK